MVGGKVGRFRGFLQTVRSIPSREARFDIQEIKSEFRGLLTTHHLPVRFPLRRCLGVVLASLGLLACHPKTDSVGSLPEPKPIPAYTGPLPTVRFLALGDWGTGAPEQRQVAAALAGRAKADSTQFVMSVGDNFYGYLQSADDPQWANYFENVYTDTLKREWYTILGNHDYYGNAQAQLDYARTHPGWKLPARDYTFSKRLTLLHRVQFFCIDTNPFAPEFAGGVIAQVAAQDSTRQLRWLDSALTASRATWKIVVGHHPIFSTGHHGDTPLVKQRILPILKKHRVQAYFCGHDHDLQHLRVDGMDFVVTGAAGQTRTSPRPADGLFRETMKPGFVSVAVGVDSLRCRYYDGAGNLLYQFGRGRK